VLQPCRQQICTGGPRTSPVSDWGIIGSEFSRTGLIFTIQRCSASECARDKVKRVNGMLKPASARTKVRTYPRHRAPIRDLKPVRWAQDASGNRLPVLDKRDPTLGHMGDAFAYMTRAVATSGSHRGQPYALLAS
jgi:hypothetical protein